jgi:hypothetical protein
VPDPAHDGGVSAAHQVLVQGHLFFSSCEAERLTKTGRSVA